MTTTLAPNLARDLETVTAMVRIYCRAHHDRGTAGLCGACAELAGYAELRLSKCPFGAAKTTCRECPVHCYRPGERETMKQVMRFAGPRMLWQHPWLALRHLWLERQGAPPWPPKARRQSLSENS